MRFYDLTFGLYIILLVCSGCAIALGNYMYDEFWPEHNQTEEYREKKIEEEEANIDLAPPYQEVQRKRYNRRRK